MAFRSLQFIPGLNTQLTPTLNRAGWSASNLIRFPASSGGLAEVIGGWQNFFNPQVQLQGVCRGLHSWATLLDVLTLGAGTTERLYVCQGGAPYDVTPVFHISALTNPFTTTAASAIVRVRDAGYHPAVGDFIEVSGGSAVGGITLSGEYTVLTIGVPTADDYTIQAASPAGSGATGGGTPTIMYLLPVGDVDQSVGTGWGVGGWGLGTWGTPRPSSGSVVFPTIWEIDNWGEEMVAVRRGSTVYDWKPSSGLATRATAISGAPPAANGVLVAMPEQQLIAWGTSIPDPVGMSWGVQDPMMIAWTDFANYNDWFASATNAAGSFRLTQGSQIMLVLRSQGQMLVWTDTAFAAMQFISLPFVYGFQQLGTACGLISPKAAAVVGGKAFWWAAQNFFKYDGTVEPLPCAIRDLVFNGLNTNEFLKICCSVNTEFSEIQWEYPSVNSSENDSYVSYNYANGTWGYGTLASGVSIGRTARIDAGVYGYPIAADASGNVWLHEQTYTAGGSSMPWSAQSGYADIAEGEQFVFTDLVIPDAVQSGGDIGITISAQDYPTDTPVTQGPYNAGPDVEYIPVRLRSRQIAIQFANSNAIPGLFWRLGRVRVRAAADGRR